MYCDSELRKNYTRTRMHEKNRFQNTKKAWHKIFMNYFTTTVEPTSIVLNWPFSGYLPASGHSFKIDVLLEYKNLAFNDSAQLIADKEDREYEIKNILNKHNDLGYYFANVIEVTLISLHIDFSHSKAKVRILGEMITTDDYYDTIGRYRQMLETLCTKKMYNPEGIVKILEDFGVQYEEDDDLCEMASDIVNNLKWDDFGK